MLSDQARRKQRCVKEPSVSPHPPIDLPYSLDRILHPENCSIDDQQTTVQEVFRTLVDRATNLQELFQALRSTIVNQDTELRNKAARSQVKKSKHEEQRAARQVKLEARIAEEVARTALEAARTPADRDDRQIQQRNAAESVYHQHSLEEHSVT